MNIFTFLLFLIFVVSAFGNKFFDFQVEDAEGNLIPLSQYSKAKAILVGNTLNLKSVFLLIIFKQLMLQVTVDILLQIINN
jgi:hypothetical protein